MTAFIVAPPMWFCWLGFLGIIVLALWPWEPIGREPPMRDVSDTENDWGADVP
jgi:hypothetical protein